MQNLFGTDGIRDRAGEGLLSSESLDRLATALAAQLRRDRSAPPRVLVGRDTRVSGPSIEEILIGSFRREGLDIESAGILPTPAISLLVAEEGFDLGVVISASHNPPRFNGVKLFDRWGRKLEVTEEEAITREYQRTLPRPGARGMLSPSGRLRERYIEILLASFPRGAFLDGFRIVIDCARGATATVAGEVFRRTGAEVKVLFDELDGERINHGCGSLHPEELRRTVSEKGWHLGIAFDGDGDRALLVDDRGDLVDGDDMLGLWALSLKEKGLLAGNRVVATVMANAGIERYLHQHGVELTRTPVGDREVFEGLGRWGAVLGGEQSGHLIYSRESATGDGLRTGLHLCRLVHESGERLSKLRSSIPRYPQILLAVDVPTKVPLAELPEVTEEIERARVALEGRGRLLVRYSGTEPVARILVEGSDSNENQQWAQRIAEALRSSIGVET